MRVLVLYLPVLKHCAPKPKTVEKQAELEETKNIWQLLFHFYNNPTLIFLAFSGRERKKSFVRQKLWDNFRVCARQKQNFVQETFRVPQYLLDENEKKSVSIRISCFFHRHQRFFSKKYIWRFQKSLDKQKNKTKTNARCFICFVQMSV